jgi:hypothetical protein
MTDWTAMSDAATVKRLARIIRDGTDAQANRAYDDTIATHGREDGGILWDQACQLVDHEQAERENAEGGAS